MGFRRRGTAVLALGLAGLASGIGGGAPGGPSASVAQDARPPDRAGRNPGPWEGVASQVPGPEPGDLARLRARAESRDRPRDWLAFGAALLSTGDWEGSTGPLRRALESDDAGVREDAAYDLALAFAVAGRPPEETGAPRARPAEGADEVRQKLLQARDGFRAVLRSNPEAADARWNLELVDRWLRREQQSGGGGGGSQDAGGGGDGADARDAPMTEQEAQRLLEAAAGAERAVQERRLERNRSRDPAADRNW
jgi:hypothetical protein